MKNDLNMYANTVLTEGSHMHIQNTSCMYNFFFFFSNIIYHVNKYAIFVMFIWIVCVVFVMLFGEN